MGIGREKEEGRVAISKGARPLLRSLDFEETEELCKSFRQKGDLVKFAFYWDNLLIVKRMNMRLARWEADRDM